MPSATPWRPRCPPQPLRRPHRPPRRAWRRRFARRRWILTTGLDSRRGAGCGTRPNSWIARRCPTISQPAETLRWFGDGLGALWGRGRPCGNEERCSKHCCRTAVVCTVVEIWRRSAISPPPMGATLRRRPRDLTTTQTEVPGGLNSVSYHDVIMIFKTAPGIRRPRAIAEIGHEGPICTVRQPSSFLRFCKT